MDVEGPDSKSLSEDVETEETHLGISNTEDGEDSLSRPSTPSMQIFDILPKNEDEWWRPSHPPETYLWEEVRRQRQRGGYPWTLLDKDDELDAEDYLDENVYEPVNPPPLHELQGTVTATCSSKLKIIDIPPDIEIVNSEGLDGLDQLDSCDRGIDGDKEWMHSDDETSPHVSFREDKVGEVPEAFNNSGYENVQPGSQNISENEPGENDTETRGDKDQQVPSSSQHTVVASSPAPPRKTTTAFEILKSKAEGVAGQVRQRINKIALPIRPKLNKWEGVKLSRRKPKKRSAQSPGPEEPTEPDIIGEELLEDVAVEKSAEEDPTPEDNRSNENDEKEATNDTENKPEDSKEEEPKKDKETAADEKKRKQKELDDLKHQKVEEKKKAKEELERKKAEEKKAKEEAAAEAKRIAEEEKKTKQEAAALAKRVAEEEKKAKQEAAAEIKRIAEEEKKAKQEAAAEAKRIAEEEKKAKQEAAAEAKRIADEEEKKAKQEAAAEAKRIADEEKKAKEEAAAEATRVAEEAKKLAIEEAKTLAAEEAKKLADQEEAKRLAAEEAKRIVEEKKKVNQEQELAEKQLKVQEELLQKVEQEAEDDEYEYEYEEEEDAEQPQDTEKLQAEEGPHGAEEPEANKEEQAKNLEDTAETDLKETLPEDELVTPTGTGKRKKKIVKRPQLPQLPQLPHIDLDEFKKKFKRRKIPPPRPKAPKVKVARKEVEEIAEPEAQGNAEASEQVQSLEQDERMDQADHTETTGLYEPQEIPAEVPEKSIQDSKKKDKTPSKSKAAKVSSSKAETADEPEKDTPSKQQVAIETLDKFGTTLKGLGVKSKAIASKTSKGVGEKMKVIGKDLQKLGVKVNEKYQSTMEEIKAKQEAAKERSKQKAKEAEDVEDQEPVNNEVFFESATEPRRKFKGRKSTEDMDFEKEPEQQGMEYYKKSGADKNQQVAADGDNKMTRGQLLGRADRDWESPLDLAQSRDVSEEPFSENPSSRNSPPGSSLASSTFAHVRKQGVLEEIDSDEFFLREKGISEGEDPEEINRFLVEELRNAFRPNVSNALAGFDLPSPPERPERPRKTPRADAGDESPNYQTFPPERPRRKTPGYVSSYMHEQQNYLAEDQEGATGGDDQKSNPYTLLPDEERDFEGSKYDGDGQNEEEFEDDGRYEPVSEEPIKPQRKKRKQRSAGPLYYNTIAGNEWMMDLEEQVTAHEDQPVAPVRERKKSGKSGSLPPDTGDFGDDQVPVDERVESCHTGYDNEEGFDDAELEIDDSLEYVDEAGYAVVHKDRDLPRTIPRKKKKTASKGESSPKMRSQAPSAEGEPDDAGGQFFSLPRFTPRTFHIVPPSRPQRNYSTLKPRRPPRNKSASNQNLQKDKKEPSETKDESRPSTAIGIMQGRPLPPPPRPERAPTAVINDLDHTFIERAVGAQHYANFDEARIADGVIEEPFTATNVPHLGRNFGTSGAGDMNIGIQTDPFPEDELDMEAIVRAYTNEEARVEQQSDNLDPASRERIKESRNPQPHLPSYGGAQPQFEPSANPRPQFSFPRRLHLDELEVNILRVNDLTAHSINVEHLQAPQLEVNSLTSMGLLSVSSIQTQTLNSDEVNCNRLSSDTVDLPSVPPPSFYHLSSSQTQSSQVPTNQPKEPLSNIDQGTEEFHLHASEKEEKENESSCPFLENFENFENPYENIESIRHVETSVGDVQFSEMTNIKRPHNNDFTCMLPHADEINFVCGDNILEIPRPTEPDSIKSENEASLSRNVSEEIAEEVLDQYADEYDQLTDTLDDYAKYSEDMQDSSVPSEDVLKSYGENSENISHTEPDYGLRDPGQQSVEQVSCFVTLQNPEPRVVCEESLSTLIQEDDEDEVEQDPEPLVARFTLLPLNSTPTVTHISEPAEQEVPVVPPRNPVHRSSSAEIFLRNLQFQIEGTETPTEATSSSTTSPRDSCEVKIDLDLPAEPAVPSPPTLQRTDIIHQPSRSIIVTEEVIQTSQPTMATYSAPAETYSNLQETVLATPTMSSTMPATASLNFTFDSMVMPQTGEEAMQLGIRFGRAVSRLVMRALEAMIEYIDTATSDDPSKSAQQKSNMQVLLCLLLMLIAGILLTSPRSGSSNPRWEFLMPPPDL